MTFNSIITVTNELRLILPVALMVIYLLFSFHILKLKWQHLIILKVLTQEQEGTPRHLSEENCLTFYQTPWHRVLNKA